MPVIIASLCVVALYLVLFFSGKPHDRTGLDRGRILDTVLAVRFVYIAGLCTIPVLVVVSIMRNNGYIFSMAESAVPVISGALFLIGLSSLGQRSLAVRFNMHAAFSYREIFVMMGLPLLLYLSFLPNNNALIIYLAPGCYCGFLVYLMLKERFTAPAARP